MLQFADPAPPFAGKSGASLAEIAQVLRQLRRMTTIHFEEVFGDVCRLPTFVAQQELTAPRDGNKSTTAREI
ncbi:hypothetical protein IVA98_13215 [Bradyrhizobium sp. 160]|uniref:hypothetical protein n=1 Tax=Bradyrhizobium sp. 160 TaxID=2782634 RepID=UPI001FFB0F6A|nr:hypothetical protein [Bradyrhizobium sp. 160]MCK1624121.1 hypothetical protein [Bradyrhizobium sp. 160]